MKNKKFSWLILLLVAVTTVGLASVFSQQNDSAGEQRNSIQKKIHVEDYPIADYESSDSTDPIERDKRKITNKSHDLSTDLKAEDVKRFALKDSDPEILIPLAVSHPKTESGIPVNDSQIIAVGEINDAHAYLSNDKTNVYSEFSVSVTDVLKNATTEPLIFGAQIVVERTGGRVRFPSGKLLVRGAPYGRNMPRAGRRYVFFLKQSGDGRQLSIITAYEVRSGLVFPLDGLPEGDVGSKQFVEYEAFAGMDALTFMNRVKEGIKKLTHQ